MTPTTDYISRKEVMKEFVKMKEGFTEDLDYATGIKSGIDACIYRVINTPSIQDNSSQIREIIEKKLLKENNSYDKAYSQCYQELLDEIDNLPNQSQWTPVSTPPTDSGGYIVCEEYLEGKQHIGVEYYYHLSDVWSRPNSITHWQNLPLPPTK